MKQDDLWVSVTVNQSMRVDNGKGHNIRALLINMRDAQLSPRMKKVASKHNSNKHRRYKQRDKERDREDAASRHDFSRVTCDSPDD